MGVLSTAEFNISEEMVTSSSFQDIPCSLFPDCQESYNPSRVVRGDWYVGSKKDNFNINFSFLSPQI